MRLPFMLFSRLRGQRYCAFCKVLRRIYIKKHVDLTNVLCAIAFTFATAYLIWSEPDPRGLFIFCLYIAGAEIFVYLRWRMSVTCKMCGFNPILYHRSPALASARVKEFFYEQVENPQFWLTQSPLLQLQKRIRTREKKNQEIRAMSRRAKASTIAPGKSL